MMKVVFKLLLTILITVENIDPCVGKAQTDYCSDKSDTYSYTAVYSGNPTWHRAARNCLLDSHGCLARSTNKTVLAKIKKEIPNNTIHGMFFYWVGLRRDISGTLMWDNGQKVKIDDGIRGIVNVSTLKKEVCYAVTNSAMLQPFHCSTTEKYICQIPNTKVTQPTTPKTKKPKTKVTAYTNKPTTTKKMTGGLKSFVDTEVDKYVAKAKKMKAGDKNSINSMLKLTSELIKILKTRKKVKGNIMKAALTMEKFGMEYAKHHLKSLKITRMVNKSEGLVFEMRKVSSKQRIVFPYNNANRTERKGGKTTIDLPDSLFDGQDKMVVNALFTEVTDFIPLTRDKNNRDKEIISPVISSTLDPNPENLLKENVTIVLEHFKQASKVKPTCVFWDISIDNYLGGDWSTDGCTLIKTNQTSTVCTCNHLTSFALLMQVDATTNSEANSTNEVVLSYITYVGCTLSLVGEALTVLAYAFLMNMKQEQCQIRVNLAISLAVAQIFFLSGITATSNSGVCTFVAVMLHYFYLVAFGWMMLEGVYLYLMVVKVFNTVIKMKLYYLFAWGFPSVFVIISLIVASTFEDGISSYTNQKFCWVSFSNGLIWTFVGPVILISMANIFILVFAIREIVNLNQGKLDQAEKFRQGVKSCVVLFPLLGLTWLFGLLAVTNAGIVFQYIFTILNSFQGFLIFVLHCLRSGEIRASFKHKLQRWEVTKLSTFTSAKSTVENSVSSVDKNKQMYNNSISDGVQEGLTKHNRVKPLTGEKSNRR